MAPVENENKRVNEVEEESAAKRQKVEGEEVEEEEQEDDSVDADENDIDIDSDEDEEDMSDDEEGADQMEFDMEEFEDVEGFTEEMLEKSQTAWQEFVTELSELAGGEDVEPMLLRKPTEIRPVPMTAAEFRERIGLLALPKDIKEFKATFAEELVDISSSFSDDELEEGQDITEEDIERLENKVVKGHVEKFAAAVKASEEKIEACKLTGFYQLLTLTDTLFDQQCTAILIGCSDDKLNEAVKALVASLESALGKALKASNEDLKMTATLREDLKSFFKSCESDLSENEKEHEAEVNGNETKPFPFQGMKFSPVV